MRVREIRNPDTNATEAARRVAPCGLESRENTPETREMAPASRPMRVREARAERAQEM